MFLGGLGKKSVALGHYWQSCRIKTERESVNTPTDNAITSHYAENKSKNKVLRYNKLQQRSVAGLFGR
jgi:hypothetical protein